jgi:hypothetical protein
MTMTLFESKQRGTFAHDAKASRRPTSMARRAIALAWMACASQGATATPVGVSSFTYEKDGIKIVLGLDDVLRSMAPATGISPPLAIAFSETRNGFTLQISGGDFDLDSTDTFLFDGSYWDGTLGISQDSGFLFDFLSFSGSFNHAVGPHREADRPTMSFNSPFFIPNPIEFPTHPDGVVTHLNQHQDRYSGFVNATFLVGDITTWTMVLQAQHHKAPEPTTSLLMGMGLLGLMASARKRADSSAVSARAAGSGEAC